MDFIQIIIDNRVVEVSPNITVMQACLEQKIDIPRFCYHERLSIAGSCRMCLVEVSNSKKLVASCAFPVVEGLRIYTNSLRVKKAREGVLEFLLANHPLDCPICDQGGECDLQDITMVFGPDRGRFYEVEKRAIEDKDCGPFIKTVMTRCIHCTRCVRFLSELGTDASFGTTGRGLAMQIGTYIPQSLEDELCGNIIDLCPVGALTSKPFAFTSRTWELTALESLDIMDTLGTRIRLDVFFNKIMRILPRQSLNNEDWISNLTRYSYEGLNNQRLVSPMVRQALVLNKQFSFTVQKANLIPVSWEFALSFVISKLLQTKNIQITLGDFLDTESIVVSKDVFNFLGVSSFVLENNYLSNFDLTHHFLLNISLITLETKIINFVLLGFCPRIENPLFNLRLRRSFLKYNTKYYSVGGLIHKSFPVINLGLKVNSFFSLIEGRHSSSRKNLFSKTTIPHILIGLGLQSIRDANYYINVLSALNIMFNKYISYYVLTIMNKIGYSLYSFMSSRVTPLVASYIGLNNTLVNFSEFIYSINSNEKECPLNSFVCYQGAHGDSTAESANIVLPAFGMYEVDSTLINIEGFVHNVKRIINGAKNILSHHDILMELKSLYLKLSSNGLLSSYLESVSGILYKYLDSKVISYYWTSVKKNFNTWNNSIYKNSAYYQLNNLVLNQPYYTYYNQNVIGRVSRSLSAASKIELKKLAIIRKGYRK